MNFRSNIKWYLLTLLLFTSLLLWSVALRENREGKLKIVFLNVGQGSATYIESPTGTQIVIDGGPNRALNKELSAILPWYDKHIDAILVTNSDRDHYEGFFSFLDKYRTDVFIESGVEGVSDEFKSLEKKVESKKVKSMTAQRGQIIDLGGGAYIEILFPDRNVAGLSTNTGSIVSRLVYGETSIIMQGDSPSVIEEYLIGLNGRKLDSDILVAGHHGSRTSTSDKYVKVVTPEYAVISSGKGNSYGHPHKEVIDTLTNNKVEILRTDELGRITFVSDGKELKYTK